jgi:DNA-binding NarL/FixJ family response regulator
MPSRVEQPARREAARRQAVVVLRVAEAIASHAAERLADGLGPEAARRAAIATAAELELAAAKLRRLTGRPLSPAEAIALDKASRRELAAELVAAGWTRREVAGRLAVHPRTVGKYLRPGSGHRGSPARSGGDCGPDDT